MDIVSLEEQPKKRAKTDNNKEAEAEVEDERDAVAVTPTSPTFPEEILEKTFLKLEQIQDVKAASDAAFGKVFPMIFPLLGREDILNSRLVCKLWASTVDSLLQTRPYDRTWERYPLAPSSSGNGDGLGEERKEPVYAPVFQTNLVMKDLGPLCLYPTAKLNKYLNEMTGHAANPLVLRAVELTNEDEDLEAQKVYWNTVLVFLSTFGHHIWTAAISPSVQHDRNDPTYNYSVFRTALTLMPNLKSLSVMGFESSKSKQKRFLTEYIQRFPLPELPNLESVKNLLPKGSKHRPVMDEIMRRYLKLNRIRTKVSFLRPSNIYNRPHLTHLSLKIDVGPEFWKSFCATLKAPNLARLDLMVASKFKLSTILRPLRFNFPALEYLNFRFLGKLTDFSGHNLPRFFMEKIKTLEVFHNSRVVYEQIIGHMPGLEYILVCCDDEEKRERQVEDMEEQLQIRDYILSESMYKCDIWLKMKHLKAFTIGRLGNTGDTETEIIQKKTYTRDEYILQKEKARE